MEKVVCEKRSYSKHVDNHFHKYGQLILPIEGEMTIKTNSDSYKVDGKHLFYVPSESEHIFSADRKNEFLVLDIPNNMECLSEKQIFNREELMLFDDRWKALRFLFIQESKRINSRASMKLLQYAFEIIKESYNFVCKSQKYIDDNFQEKISLGDLARMENFSESYFISWFQKRIGFTPNEYIQLKRVEKAKELLYSSEYSLAIISSIVGYEHQSSLTRTFKKFVGVTPAQYRRIE